MYGNHRGASVHKRDLKRNHRLRWDDRQSVDGHETKGGKRVRVDLRVKRVVL